MDCPNTASREESKQNASFILRAVEQVFRYFPETYGVGRTGVVECSTVVEQGKRRAKG